MGLFDKKFCSVCGEKIGFLGNRKLEDGNLCKDCANKLSPFFSDRRRSTVDDIKEQLAYREANQERVAEFNPTKVIGAATKIYFDEDKAQCLISSKRNWRDVNPDVMDFTQITGCDLDIDENRSELKRRDADGNTVSYNPPRYEYSYDFYLMVHVNSPWFHEIRFKLNEGEINNRGGIAYREASARADEIKQTFSKVKDDFKKAAEAASAPKQAMTCPFCGATTTPDENGCCEYCGGALK